MSSIVFPSDSSGTVVLTVTKVVYVGSSLARDDSLCFFDVTRLKVKVTMTLDDLFHNKKLVRAITQKQLCIQPPILFSGKPLGQG